MRGRASKGIMEMASPRPDVPRPTPLPASAALTAVVASDWRTDLPVLAGAGFTLRELRREDAPNLVAHLGTVEVSRFMAPPPATVAGFEEFIARTHRDRSAGKGLCFAVVPDGADDAVGVFHVRSLEVGFGTAEWDFALGSTYWGTGLFQDCAARVLEFLFDTVGVLRLEARVAVINGRGNGALRKSGAVQEGVLRRSFNSNGQYYDQVMWSLLADDWRMQRSARRLLVH